MIMFKVGIHDFSDHVIAGSYSVNSQDVYKSWTDINGEEHRDKIRDRITGSFDMYFGNIEEYEDFIGKLEAAKQSNLSYEVALCDNRTNELKVRPVFISFQLTRNRDGSWNDLYERFKVNVQEK